MSVGVGFTEAGKYCYRCFRPITERHQCQSFINEAPAAALPRVSATGVTGGGTLVIPDLDDGAREDSVAATAPPVARDRRAYT